MIKLHPCPMCGYEPEVVTRALYTVDNVKVSVRCTGCGLNGLRVDPGHWVTDGALRRITLHWNKRALSGVYASLGQYTTEELEHLIDAAIAARDNAA